MKTRVLICVTIPAVVFATISLYFCDLNSLAFMSFYSDKLRAPLFTGFLGFGGFLFSLKTFIVIKMKENVYDNKNYIANYQNHKKLGAKNGLYTPLKQLSDLLFYTVVSALLTSAMQFTVGFIPCPPAAIICSWAAFATLLLVLVSLWEIKKNLNRWFESLEKSNHQ